MKIGFIIFDGMTTLDFTVSLQGLGLRGSAPPRRGRLSVGKRATTHPKAFKELEPFCASVVEHRVVDEGNVITARGVTAAIDLGLYLCEKLAGLEVKERIRRQMDYEGAGGTVRGGRTGG